MLAPARALRLHRQGQGTGDKLIAERERQFRSAGGQ